MQHHIKHSDLRSDDPWNRLVEAKASDGDLLHGGDSTMYYTIGTNGSVTAIDDPTCGTIQERHVYDVYGREQIDNRIWAHPVGSTHGANVLYRGYLREAGTNLDYARNRYQHPTKGSWISQDPAGYVDGDNLYEYVQTRACKVSGVGGTPSTT